MKHRHTITKQFPLKQQRRPNGMTALHYGQRIRDFMRRGPGAAALVKVIEQVTDNDEATAVIIDAVIAYTADLQRLRRHRGPMGMRASAKHRPDPFVRVGGARVMLPKEIYRPGEWLSKRLR